MKNETIHIVRKVITDASGQPVAEIELWRETDYFGFVHLSDKINTRQEPMYIETIYSRDISTITHRNNPMLRLAAYN